MTIRKFVLGAATGLTGLVMLLPGAAPAAVEEGNVEEVSADTALAAQGAAVFAQRCMGCHSADPDMQSYGGPNLAGVVGRPAGAGKFRYSSAMRNSGLTWTAEELDGFIASPMAKVPGTSMVISLPDGDLRNAVIAFLETTSAREQLPVQ